MKVVLEDMYSTTVAVPGLTIEVYSRYKQGELLENLPCEIKRGGLAKPGGSFFPDRRRILHYDQSLRHKCVHFSLLDSCSVRFLTVKASF